MKIKRMLLLLAILAYIGSFFLTAVRDSAGGGGFSGYWCALTTLTAPWGSDGLKELRQDPVDFFSVLFSGWINPLFLATLIVRWRRPHGRLAWILGAILLILLPACWVVFAKAHLRPSIGYFVWTAAMIVALFAGAFASADRAQAAGHPA
jgi:multidrug transporter EmrE-like cation transporter